MGTAALATVYNQRPAFYAYGGQNEPQFDYRYFEFYMADKYGTNWKTKTGKTTTQKNEENYLRKFSEWLSFKGIEQPTRDDVRAYIDDLAARGLTAGTQSQYARETKAFFHWCSVRGLYPDIADGLKGAKIRHDTHKRDALERKAVPEIADTIDRTTEGGKRDYAIYLLMISAGTRCIELNRANVGDVREESGKIYLDIQRKGHEEKDGTIEIVPEVWEAVRDYLEARQPKPTPESPLFTSTSNNSRGERIAASTIGAIMKRVLVNAGYNSRRLTGHSLRHTSATGCWRSTGNIETVREHCGHADISTSQIYIHDEDRKDRTDEQDTYNYFFKADEQDSKREKAVQLINDLPDDKLTTAIELLQAISGKGANYEY